MRNDAQPIAGLNLTEAKPQRQTTKHQQIFDYLQTAIQSGQLKAGDRIPTELELGKMFSASRITAAKAVLELQRIGLVARRPGAGTHVLGQQDTSTGRTFGLLIPGLGLTEIFEPICHGMMRSSSGTTNALLWGHASTTAQQGAKEAEYLVQCFIAQKVSGIFFAPIELFGEKDPVNRRIVSLIEQAGIPMVLLDRCFLPYPERSKFDLVGVDNRRAGFVAASHLLKMGVRRLVFVGEVHSANTVDARVTGFLEALRSHGIDPDWKSVWRGNPQDETYIKGLIDSARPEGIVCANDITAARLMQTLGLLGVRIPDEVRIVGMDDVKYASLLPVPLTTIHQDCEGIGAVAIATMLQRLQNPGLPARDVLVPFRLVVRRSCGAHQLQKSVG